MGDVTVITGTYGADEWCDLARERAAASVPDDVRWVHVHLPDGRLHEARNAALAEVDTPWVIHLDADDELAPGYVEAMLAADGDLRVPMVQYVRGGRPRPAIWPQVSGHQHDCTGDCLSEGNWLVLGAMVRTDLLRSIGGWRNFPWSEDWDVWLRCSQAGASIERVPDAIYRAHVRPDSRNRAPDRAFKLAAHEAIHRANFPELYEEAA